MLRFVALIAAILLLSGPLAAAAAVKPPHAGPPRLPHTATSRHVLTLPDRTLTFTARAGSIMLRDASGAPEAEIATIAYTLDGADPQHRPVTFVFNGGPGEASAWLQLGAVGPWRIAMGGTPSAAPDLLPNAETWLDFTDLVFIDPAGTGYSQILATGAAARHQFWSVNGDIDSLAEAIRRWLEEADRVPSPKFLLGESYGGFRVPRLAHALAEDQGIGIRGLIMVSPVLDFAGSSAFDPLFWVERLPSLVAVARSKEGAITRAGLADAEAYAVGDFLTDQLAGPRNVTARTRMAARVAALTGLDPKLVFREDGSIDFRTFRRESSPGAIASIYDATITDPDAFPTNPWFPEPDPIFRLTPSFTSAMLILYRQQLHWQPASLYRLFNPEVERHWDWGHEMAAPQAVTALREDLAVDPAFSVLIAHGLFDLITPYFRTALILRHLPDIGPSNRVRLVTFPGGHMFYSRAPSRAAFRADALALISGQ